MASPHIIIFPFMAKGHMTPLLELARHLRRMAAAVTLVTTPANRPFVTACLSATGVTILDIPFPRDVEGIPAGVESTDMFPDASLWFKIAIATKRMQPQFEETLKSLPRVSFMITDFFLAWTLDSAKKFGIPRLASVPMGSVPMCVMRLLAVGRFSTDGEGIKLHDCPWMELKKVDVPPTFMDRPGTNAAEQHDFVCEEAIAITTKSYGVVMNTVYELESQFVDVWTSKIGPPAWCLGPLSPPARQVLDQANRPTPWWISWLDKMKADGKSVLYAAFGTQVEISAAQFREIQAGLEESGVNFLWLVRDNESDLEDGFEARVRNQGIVVKEWVDQREILDHESVRGYLSHCGWSSLMESVCARVPILAWPMMWEQPLNAKAVELAGVALRLEARGDGWATREALAKGMKDLMEGDAGKEVRKKVEEVGGAAGRALEDGGSSWMALTRLINELQ